MMFPDRISVETPRDTTSGISEETCFIFIFDDLPRV